VKSHISIALHCIFSGDAMGGDDDKASCGSKGIESILDVKGIGVKFGTYRLGCLDFGRTSLPAETGWKQEFAPEAAFLK
jgi:hypothetical protein